MYQNYKSPIVATWANVRQNERQNQSRSQNEDPNQVHWDIENFGLFSQLNQSVVILGISNQFA